MMDTYRLGQAVRNMYGTTGYVYDVADAGGNQYSISAGLRPITKKIKIVYPENSAFSEISEHDFPRWRGWAGNEPDIDPATLPDIIKTAQENIAKGNQARAAAMEYATRRRAEFVATYAPQVPAWAKAVLVAELRVNESDIQTDYFTHSTARVLILGFSTHTRDLFREMAAAAGNAPETEHMTDEHDEHREKYSMGGGYYLTGKGGGRHSGWIIRKISLSSPENLPSGEWRVPTKARPAPKQPEPTAAPAGARIEEHTHTKKGFQMFICVFPRVDRAEFDRLLDKARNAGGWYSRQWGATPGGFAFKSREAAEAFIGGADVPPTPAPESAPADSIISKGNQTTAARLRTIADGMQATIDDKFRDRLTNTPKRLAQAEHARLEGRQLERAQKMLRALADMHESGTVPAVLQHVKTKAEAYRLAHSKREQVANGFHSYSVETGRPYYETPDALAAWALLENRTPEQDKAEKLRRLVQGLQFSNIPGYFPTPADLVARMLNRAGIESGQKALEPSAGHGAIADALRDAGADVTVYETNYTLAEILTAKGYNDPRADFMETTPAPVFDRVVMNPPFEKLQDVDHVRHAFAYLKPGGRLVAIMSAGTFNNSTRKAAEFREWLDNLGGESEEIPAGAFKESGTGVSARLVVVDREATSHD